jgi:hypothetical protein
MRRVMEWRNETRACRAAERISDRGGLSRDSAAIGADTAKETMPAFSRL